MRDREDAKPARDPSLEAWEAMRRFRPDPRLLARNRVVTAERSDPAAGAIDLLRTRILNAMEERGWHHLGITSPTKGCGKTFISANLGFSLARQKHLRTLLLDMDLRNPSIERAFGIPDAGALVPALEDTTPLEDRFLRLSDTFAVVANDTPTDTAAEVLKSSITDRVLSRTFDRLRPGMVLYDLPPVLACDDVLAFRHRLDAVLVIIRGGHSSRQEVRDLEALLEGEIPILATVLNEAEDGHVSHYVRS